MTRLPVINARPHSFELCLALGLGLHDSGEASHADASDDEEPLPDAEQSVDQHEHVEGPCPFVGCADHLAWLAIDVADPRSLTAKQLSEALGRLEQLDLSKLSITCARRGPYTLEQVGSVWEVSREWIRQIETKALEKIRHPALSASLKPLLADGHDVSRPDLYDREEDARAASNVSTRRGPGRRASAAATALVRACGRARTRAQWAAELGVEQAEIVEQARALKRSFGRHVELLLGQQKRAAAAHAEMTSRAELLDQSETASTDGADELSRLEPDVVDESAPPAPAAPAATATEPEVVAEAAADELLAQALAEPSAPEAPGAETALELEHATRAVASVAPQPQHAPALRPAKKPTPHRPKSATKPRTAPPRAERGAATAKIVSDAAKAFAAIVRNAERRGRR
jgi:hypothetical protein